MVLLELDGWTSIHLHDGPPTSYNRSSMMIASDPIRSPDEHSICHSQKAQPPPVFYPSCRVTSAHDRRLCLASSSQPSSAFRFAIEGNDNRIMLAARGRLVVVAKVVSWCVGTGVGNIAHSGNLVLRVLEHHCSQEHCDGTQ